jgi:hypothetical protein
MMDMKKPPRKKRREDAHSRYLARSMLKADYRHDLSLSDLQEIARLVGNRTLARLVLEAVT